MKTNILEFKAGTPTLNNVREFVATTSNVNERDADGNTVLLLVAGTNNVFAIKLLLDVGADANVVNYNGQTPLMLAAAGMSSECVDILLQAGAKTDDECMRAYTPLTLAALCNKSVAITQHLIDAGADLNAKTSNGDTPLMIASFGGKFNIFNILVNSGADVNERSSYNLTPIAYVIDNNNALKYVKKLVDAGAYITLPCRTGKTVLETANDLNKNDVVNFLTPLVTRERLLCERILFNADIEEGICEGVYFEKMPTIKPYYMLSDAETRTLIGTFTPDKGLNGMKLYDEYENLTDAICGVYEKKELISTTDVLEP